MASWYVMISSARYIILDVGDERNGQVGSAGIERARTLIAMEVMEEILQVCIWQAAVAWRAALLLRVEKKTLSKGGEDALNKHSFKRVAHRIERVLCRR
jgi:hypothetical protein